MRNHQRRRLTGLETGYWPLTTGPSADRRRGVTLTECLVAIFICGIGLIALMTLFPLGALNMAQALRDDRASHCAGNASAILRTMWRYHLNSGQADPNFDAQLKAAANSNKPVYLDPIGHITDPNGLVGGSIQRVTLPTLASKNNEAVRWCTMLDDIEFAKNGLPMPETPYTEPSPTKQIRREGKFSWAWMIRLLNPNDPRVIQYSVVVYQNRPISLDPGLSLSGERSVSATFNISAKTLTFPYGLGANRPNLRKGGWVMDAQSGYFYRAVGIRDRGGMMEIEVHTPFRAGTQSSGQVVIMDNVVEVFERGTLE